jgi:hypothetical protein
MDGDSQRLPNSSPGKFILPPWPIELGKNTEVFLPSIHMTEIWWQLWICGLTK